ncbi:MAG: class I SAM-dependent methyltransferase [Pseudomonadota bacterium]
MPFLRKKKPKKKNQPTDASASPTQASQETIESIIKDNPSLHRRPDGSPWFLGISGQTFKTIIDLLEPGMNTIETGAGFSSLAFILKGTNHRAVCPDRYLEDNIRTWCDSQRLDHSKFTFVAERSQDFLPNLDDDLDFALIDGDHAFPIPMIDYYYIARRLSVGGFLAIDDCNLWTGDVIVKNLMMDSAWEFYSEHHGRTVIFRRTAPWQDGTVGSQPYLLANSRGLPSYFYDDLKK